METKMPPNGINLRSEQLALLRGLEHQMVTAPAIETLLTTVEEHPDYENLDVFANVMCIYLENFMMNRLSYPKHL